MLIRRNCNSCVFLSFLIITKLGVRTRKTLYPHISKCPEYWEVNPDDNTKCVNSGGINGAID